MNRSIEFELRTLRERNQRGASMGARMALAAREKEQRETTAGHLRTHLGAPPPRYLFPTIEKPGFTLPNKITVTLTRMAPGELDSDGVDDALKNVRDGVADWLCIDDSKRGGVEWRYGQEKTAAGVYRVRVEVTDATKGEDVRKVLASEAEHHAGALQRVRPKKASAQALLPVKPSYAVLPWEQPFNAAAVIVRLLRGGPESEDVIIRHVERRAEEHFGDDGYSSREMDPARTLFDMVQAGALTWRDPPGGDDAGTKPLVYALVPNKSGAAIRNGLRLAPLVRFSRVEDPPARIEVPVPAEHAARYGAGTIKLTRRAASFKATGPCWLYERTDRS